MATIEFPIQTIGNNTFEIIASLKIYSKEAITSALYKYTECYFVHQEYDDINNSIKVVFESKNETVITKADVKQFCNDLIDYQLRYDTNKQFGHIRDLIVEQAFKPISK